MPLARRAKAKRRKKPTSGHVPLRTEFPPEPDTLAPNYKPSSKKKKKSKHAPQTPASSQHPKGRGRAIPPTPVTPHRPPLRGFVDKNQLSSESGRRQQKAQEQRGEEEDWESEEEDDDSSEEEEDEEEPQGRGQGQEDEDVEEYDDEEEEEESPEAIAEAHRKANEMVNRKQKDARRRAGVEQTRPRKSLPNNLDPYARMLYRQYVSVIMRGGVPCAADALDIPEDLPAPKGSGLKGGILQADFQALLGIYGATYSKLQAVVRSIYSRTGLDCDPNPWSKKAPIQCSVAFMMLEDIFPVLRHCENQWGCRWLFQNRCKNYNKTRKAMDKTIALEKLIRKDKRRKDTKEAADARAREAERKRALAKQRKNNKRCMMSDHGGIAPQPPAPAPPAPAQEELAVMNGARPLRGLSLLGPTGSPSETPERRFTVGQKRPPRILTDMATQTTPKNPPSAQQEHTLQQPPPQGNIWTAINSGANLANYFKQPDETPVKQQSRTLFPTGPEAAATGYDDDEGEEEEADDDPLFHQPVTSDSSEDEQLFGADEEKPAQNDPPQVDELGFLDNGDDLYTLPGGVQIKEEPMEDMFSIDPDNPEEAEDEIRAEFHAMGIFDVSFPPTAAQKLEYRRRCEKKEEEARVWRQKRSDNRYPMVMFKKLQAHYAAERDRKGTDETPHNTPDRPIPKHVTPEKRKLPPPEDIYTIPDDTDDEQKSTPQPAKKRPNFRPRKLKKKGEHDATSSLADLRTTLQRVLSPSYAAKPPQPTTQPAKSEKSASGFESDKVKQPESHPVTAQSGSKKKYNLCASRRSPSGGTIVPGMPEAATAYQEQVKSQISLAQKSPKTLTDTIVSPSGALTYVPDRTPARSMDTSPAQTAPSRPSYSPITPAPNSQPSTQKSQFASAKPQTSTQNSRGRKASAPRSSSQTLLDECQDEVMMSQKPESAPMPLQEYIDYLDKQKQLHKDDASKSPVPTPHSSEQPTAKVRALSQFGHYAPDVVPASTPHPYPGVTTPNGHKHYYQTQQRFVSSPLGEDSRERILSMATQFKSRKPTQRQQTQPTKPSPLSNVHTAGTNEDDEDEENVDAHTQEGQEGTGVVSVDPGDRAPDEVVQDGNEEPEEEADEDEDEDGDVELEAHTNVEERASADVSDQEEAVQSVKGSETVGSVEDDGDSEYEAAPATHELHPPEMRKEVDDQLAKVLEPSAPPAAPTFGEFSSSGRRHGGSAGRRIKFGSLPSHDPLGEGIHAPPYLAETSRPVQSTLPQAPGPLRPSPTQHMMKVKEQEMSQRQGKIEFQHGVHQERAEETSNRQYESSKARTPGSAVQTGQGRTQGTSSRLQNVRTDGSAVESGKGGKAKTPLKTPTVHFAPDVQGEQPSGHPELEEHPSRKFKPTYPPQEDISMSSQQAPDATSVSKWTDTDPPYDAVDLEYPRPPFRRQAKEECLSKVRSILSQYTEQHGDVIDMSDVENEVRAVQRSSAAASSTARNSPRLHGKKPVYPNIEPIRSDGLYHQSPPLLVDDPRFGRNLPRGNSSYLPLGHYSPSDHGYGPEGSYRHENGMFQGVPPHLRGQRYIHTRDVDYYGQPMPARLGPPTMHMPPEDEGRIRWPHRSDAWTDLPDRRGPYENQYPSLYRGGLPAMGDPWRYGPGPRGYDGYGDYGARRGGFYDAFPDEAGRDGGYGPGKRRGDFEDLEEAKRARLEALTQPEPEHLKGRRDFAPRDNDPASQFPTQADPVSGRDQNARSSPAAQGQQHPARQNVPNISSFPDEGFPASAIQMPPPGGLKKGGRKGVLKQATSHAPVVDNSSSKPGAAKPKPQLQSGNGGVSKAKPQQSSAQSGAKRSSGKPATGKTKAQPVKAKAAQYIQGSQGAPRFA